MVYPKIPVRHNDLLLHHRVRRNCMSSVCSLAWLGLAGAFLVVFRTFYFRSFWRSQRFAGQAGTCVISLSFLLQQFVFAIDVLTSYSGLPPWRNAETNPEKLLFLLQQKTFWCIVVAVKKCSIRLVSCE